MTVKEEIYKEIDSIKDESYLESILEWLKESNSLPVKLSNLHKEHLEKSKSEVEQGHYITHDELKIEFDKWQRR